MNLQWFKTRHQQIEREKEEFKTILPQLQELQDQQANEQEATLYRGNKGIQTLLDDMLQCDGTLCTIGASQPKAAAYQYHKRFNLPSWYKQKEEQEIPYKILLSETMQERASELNQKQHTKARILPAEFTTNSSTNIYDDTVSIILWGSQPFGIRIRSKEIAKGKRTHFAELWKQGEVP